MGILGKVKGWLNIGGVKVRLQGVEPRIPRSGGEIVGTVLLTAKGDKQVLKMVYKFVLRQTTGRGEHRRVEDHVLSQVVADEPFEIKAGESKTLTFSVPYSFEKSLKDQGGVLGALGKVGHLSNRLSGAKEAYFVATVCDVKGTALDPSHKVQVTLVG